MGRGIAVFVLAFLLLVSFGSCRHEPTGDARYIPRFHFTVGADWTGEPVGLVYDEGVYHLFYQYNPSGSMFGDIHWGHAVSRDLFRWQIEPVALSPDSLGYLGAGSVVVDRGNTSGLGDGGNAPFLAFYKYANEESGRDIFLAYSKDKGLSWSRYGKIALPDADRYAFRSPRVSWNHSLGAWLMTLSTGSSIRFYKSPDGKEWTFLSAFADPAERGTTWEGSDFFPLENRQVLLVSPQEMTAAGLEFHAGFGSIALLGSYDPAARRFERERVQSIDYGTDFYAPQTLESYDGRRIMIAWMQNWATVGCQPQGARWFGQMTLPRELSIRNGRLIQNPVRELENYRGRRVCYKDLFVTGETNLSGVSGRLLDLTVTVRPVDGRPSYQYFRLRAAKDGQRETLIRYKVSNSTLRLDRTHSGFPYDIVNVRDFPVRPQDGTVKIRLILDRFSLEVFVNDGEQAASMTIYTPLTARDISFEVVEGAAYIDVEHYSLNFEQGDAQ